MCEYWEAAYHELDARYVELARKYEALKDGSSEENELEKRINKIADHYGYEHQRLKCIEELGELIQALAKGYEQDILWEVADVTIMLQQILYLLHLNTHSAIKSKVARQESRINQEIINIKTDCQW